MDFSGNREMAGIVAVLLLLFVAAVFFYNNALNELAAGSCSDLPGACPHEKVVDTQNAVIAVLVGVVAIMAAWLGYSAHRAKPPAQAAGAAQPAAKRRKVSSADLPPEEQKVAEIINSTGGSVFQSDIMKKTGYSKVKVSRVLDRLEHKGLVERKRRGMANLVVAR
jgi:uncharacterized membrane protein